MDQLPRAMAKALKDTIRYNSAVVRIDQSRDSVQIGYLANGRPASITASRAILAVPFSTLRRIDVRPTLSAAKKNAIAIFRKLGFSDRLQLGLFLVNPNGEPRLSAGAGEARSG